MRIPVFWRLVLGYLVILIVSLGLSSYTIVQLGRLSDSARTALNTDNRMIADEEKLTDAFLSEVRYAGRFIIGHSDAFYQESLQFKSDFARYMKEIRSQAVSPDIKTRLSRINELHLRYHDLFDQEVRYIKVGQPYAESRYQQEKEKVLESALRELERLKGQLHKNLHDKLETMDKAARIARLVAAVATLLLLALGVGLSLVISNSITRPLSKLKQRLAWVSGENAVSVWDFSGVPEIQELADAFNQEKQKLTESAGRNTAFVHSVTEQLTTPLISINKRLSYLQHELVDTVTAEQKTSFAVLADETERLIQRCAHLQSSPSNPTDTQSYQEATRALEPQCSRRHHGTYSLMPIGREFWILAQEVAKRLAQHAQRLLETWSANCDAIKPQRYRKANKP
jgi:CHASE3 domain sensor protein